tara:strand:+ start:2362 stop:2718 length:357 start_codon:yes stop_codon:yes gene_type:complete
MKTALQKIYEKHLMIKVKGSESDLMLAKQNGKWGVYLVVDEVPVAKIITQRDLDETSPEYEASEILQEGLNKISKSDPRWKTLDKLDVNSLHKYGEDGFEDLFNTVIDSLSKFGTNIG